MAGEHKYFCEDEIFKLNNKGNVNLGTVLENSELLDTDDSFDLEDSYKMKSGHIRVAWHPTGEKELIKNKKVRLSNRPLMPGDVVRRVIKGKDTQRGYCRDVKVNACVQIIGTKNIIKGVNSEKMTPLREFATGVAVCIDSWVGHIKRVNSGLTLRTSDGSRFLTKDLYCSCGHDWFREKRRGCVFSHRGEYYSGQKLWGPLHKVDQSAWITRTKNLRKILDSTVKSRIPVEVTVESIEVESVHVNWQCQAFSNANLGGKGQPDSVVSGENLIKLKMMTAFEPCALRVGDRSYYTLTEDDVVISKGRWRRALKEVVLGVQKKPLKQDTLSFQATHSDETQSSDLVTGDYGDQEGQKKSDGAFIYETSTQPTDDRRMTKGPRVVTRLLKKKKLRRAHSRLLKQSLEPLISVAVETLSTSSRATIVWQDGTVEPDVPSTELYPVQKYHRELFPGDFVREVKDENLSNVYGVVQSVDRPGRTANVQWFRSYTSPGETQPTSLDCGEVSVYDLKIHRELQLRQGTKVMKVANFEDGETECFVGEILDVYPEGKVMVRWVDGNTSMCWPQDLCKVRMWKHDDSDDEELWVNASAETSWETENIHLETAANEISVMGGDSHDQNAELHPDAKIDNTHPPSPSSELVVYDFATAGNSPSVIISPKAKEERGHFLVLDTAPEGHKYKLTKFQPTAAALFCKTVRREINILRTSLPGGIWVKSFEDRMDLFSVMIVGPENTPYEDGLFLFDFQLPADYPHVPPFCHYISYCSGRLNPNLYEEGKVCVSLLGTWAGKGTEVWTSSSNLLQVLVSIQGLILVSEPYFNEPGYEKQKGSSQGWENSRTYNETVVLKMVQNASEMIQRPPSVFREEIMKHFATTTGRLCDRLEGWLDLSERFDRSKAQTSTSPSFRHFRHRESQGSEQLPEFPLVPASKGFCLSMRKRLKVFKDNLQSFGIPLSLSS